MPLVALLKIAWSMIMVHFLLMAYFRIIQTYRTRYLIPSSFRIMVSCDTGQFLAHVLTDLAPDIISSSFSNRLSALASHFRLTLNTKTLNFAWAPLNDFNYNSKLLIRVVVCVFSWAAFVCLTSNSVVNSGEELNINTPVNVCVSSCVGIINRPTNNVCLKV